jgi:hypothetical protein
MAEPAPERASGGLPFVARIVGGIVLVALVVGVGLWAERLTDDDLALPDRVAGIDADDSDAALDALDPEGRERARDDSEEVNEFNSEQLSEAYDGAEAVTRRYGVLADTDLTLLVTAVRAGSGPPVPVAFDDPERLGLAAPRNELVEKGEVTCLVTRANPPSADAEGGGDDGAPVSALCQRSDGDLTVRVLGNGEVDVDEVADATDEVWEDVS